MDRFSVSLDTLSLAHTWNIWKWRPHWLTNIFLVFILVFNKCIHFPSFLGGSWTCLDFCFLPLPAALDCATFFFFLSHHSFTSISHSVNEWRNSFKFVHTCQPSVFPVFSLFQSHLPASSHFIIWPSNFIITSYTDPEVLYVCQHHPSCQIVYETQSTD